LRTGGSMVNPFQFGKVVRDKQFCNRQRELHDLISAIKSGNSLWLYSPRRFGKTSLVVNAFSGIQNVKTVYFDLFNIRDTREFAIKYLNVLTHELFTRKYSLTSILKKLSTYLKNITPTVSLDAIGNPSIGIEVKPKELQQTIESILELPQKLNYPKPICIAFDEFQEVERLDPFLKNIMRSVFQHQQNVSYIFLGSKESLMNAIFSEVKSPFFQFGDKMNLDPISNSDLTSYIKLMFNETKLPIQNSTIENILQLSECHPHYTQYAAYVAWDLIFQDIPQNDNFKDIWLSRIIESQSDAFRTIYEQLNANQRKIVYAISDLDGQSILSNDTMIKYDLPPKSTINTALNSLLQKTLILRSNGSYKFENPIFKIWINKLYD
jgi:AAA+ ATPase superfamily predicted ATPase